MKPKNDSPKFHRGRKPEGPSSRDLQRFKGFSRLILAENLLVERLAQGLVQKDVAKLSGIHKSAVSRIEKAQTDTPLSTLDSLARGLGKEAHQLLIPR